MQQKWVNLQSSKNQSESNIGHNAAEAVTDDDRNDDEVMSSSDSLWLWMFPIMSQQHRQKESSHTFDFCLNYLLMVFNIFCLCIHTVMQFLNGELSEHNVTLFLLISSTMWYLELYLYFPLSFIWYIILMISIHPIHHCHDIHSSNTSLSWYPFIQPFLYSSNHITISLCIEKCLRTTEVNWSHDPSVTHNASLHAAILLLWIAS